MLTLAPGFEYRNQRKMLLPFTNRCGSCIRVGSAKRPERRAFSIAGGPRASNISAHDPERRHLQSCVASGAHSETQHRDEDTGHGTGSALGTTSAPPRQPIVRRVNVSRTKPELPLSLDSNHNDSQFSAAELVPGGDTASPPPDLLPYAKRRDERARQKSLYSFKRGIKEKSSFSWYWQDVLKTLDTHTQGPTSTAAEETFVTVVPAAMVYDLELRIGTNIWDIAEQYECRLQLLSRESDTDQQQPLVISGASRSVLLVRRAFSEITCYWVSGGTAILPKLDRKALESRLASVIRPVLVGRDRRARSATLPERVPRPEHWTKSSFYCYIGDLCSSPIAGTASRYLYRRVEDQLNVTCDLFLKAFSDPQAHSAITTAAGNLALQFLEKHSRVHVARKILMDMERLRVPMDVLTFNIMLRATAKARHPQTFAYILRLMTGRGVMPTSKTWIAFMMMVDSARAKMQILRRMQVKGLLKHPSSLKDALVLVVSGAMSQWLGRGGDPRAFVEFMDRTWGNGWCSTSAANQILNELGKRGFESRCLEMWDDLSQRGVRLDACSVNTLLHHFVSQHKAQSVVRILAVAEEHRIEVDQTSYDILFRLAREGHLYNVARVVWRYGCVRASVSKQMEYEVLRSLLRNSCVKPMTEEMSWEMAMGKVVVGIKQREPLPWVLGGHSQLVVPTEVEMMSKFCEWTNQDRQSADVEMKAKGMVQRDLAAFRTRCPALSLATMLERALACDEKWSQEKVWRQQTPMWKVQNAVRVVFRSLDGHGPRPLAVSPVLVRYIEGTAPRSTTSARRPL